MTVYVLGHDKKGKAVISLSTQESLYRFDWDKHLLSVVGGGTYTVGGYPKGVGFYDENGEEMSRILFTKVKSPQSFIAPKDCKQIGFL